jgi:hypothetical protein
MGNPPATPSAFMASAGWRMGRCGISCLGNKRSAWALRRAQPCVISKPKALSICPCTALIRDPQSHLGSPVSPICPGRRRPTAKDAYCWPATRRTASPGRWTGHQTGGQDAVKSRMEAGPGGQGNLAESLLQPTTPSATRLLARVLRNNDGFGPLRRETTHEGAARHDVRAPCHGRAAQRFAAMNVWSGHHYDFVRDSPLLGVRMPDLDLVTATERCGYSACCTMPGRCSQLVSPAASTSRPWADRVGDRRQYVWCVGASGHLGGSTAPTAVLIRPDGYGAWWESEPMWASLTR